MAKNVHPLNYAILCDDASIVTELRICSRVSGLINSADARDCHGKEDHCLGQVGTLFVATDGHTVSGNHIHASIDARFLGGKGT